jgi:hypothetical protein
MSMNKFIVELGFPAIYTTNYDRNLESPTSSPRDSRCHSTPPCHPVRRRRCIHGRWFAVQTLIDHLLKELNLDHSVIDGMRDGYQMLAEFYRLAE